MSLQYSEIATPCPAARSVNNDTLSSDESRRYGVFEDEFDISYDNDNTAAIDFTTEIRAPMLIGARPRNNGGKPKAFTIHEDQGSELCRARPKPLMNKSSLMLAQPAQRFQKPNVSFAVKSVSSPPRSSRKKKAPVARSPLVQKGNTPVKKKQQQQVVTNQEGQQKVDPAKKSKRRGTIYIPSDDTTMPTVFMGIFSPLKSDNLNCTNPNSTASESCELGALGAQIVRKRQQRQSLAAAPRRAPLQQSERVLQESTINHDRAGQNGGKENIPPSGVLVSESKKMKNKVLDLPEFDISVVEKPKKEATIRSAVKIRPAITTTAVNLEPKKRDMKVLKNRKSPARTALGNKSNVGAASMSNSVRKAVASKPNNTTAKINHPQPPRHSYPPTAMKARATTKPLSKLIVPHVSSLDIDQRYPLLTEDISNPEMYEDNWLAHQEIAITQLVNNLFDSGHGKSSVVDGDLLRHELLDIYQTPSFSLLYKRVNASILYGVLTVPKDILRRCNRLSEDLGLKRQFLNLWAETYDYSALCAAVETVIGRKLCLPVKSTNGCESTRAASPNQEKHSRRALEVFLETFILKNQDAEAGKANDEDVSSLGWSYRRTLLRSIMMIVLLDKARLSPDTTIPRRLFTTSSKYKSSAAVLQALGRMMLPAAGDIIRPLSHLDCHVAYEQHPLQEYEYRINNLAVDLRDGILLTRLVELLLYPSASSLLSQQNDPDATVTIAMPTGEVLSLTQGEEDWPLSQHLKVPCISRATKLCNVQIALTALSSVRGVGEIAQSVRAEDIVYGYREKTIALLWGLVGKWGLAGLVDWEDVRKEIRRLKEKIEHHPRGPDDSVSNFDDGEEEEEDFDEGYERHAFLLKQWASCLAQIKGRRLDNLTTSFADGQIFESIVDEYEYYINGKNREDRTVKESKEPGTQISNGLEARLRALGCSAQFASLVSPKSSSSSRIFDRDFTLSALAFLCSRLLSASKRVRAAVVLQRAWRCVYYRRQVQRQVVAKILATDCMFASQSRDELLRAKTVILRAWRLYKTKKEKKQKQKQRLARVVVNAKAGQNRATKTKGASQVDKKRTTVDRGRSVMFEADVCDTDSRNGIPQTIEDSRTGDGSDLWLSI
ncbi:hypothetical protein AJ80_06544 [Polytolypa hystricis UAMH7299]|uniref:Calponin-homology (CH) domain-containing protein n=1 Tax=Polytolypa hystricis (strain UAMH7299) TaxID=1447883 RepID=A0A2B7XVF0_POLH7|nr:hypothetical protein AJ80_06544 [Polytolypa hystricis UAMH7299]